MKFNEKRAKESAIDTGAAVAGAVTCLALSNKASEMAASKAPAVARHIPALILAAAIAAQALDLVPDNPMLDSALQGVGVVAGMQVIREYSGANTAAGRAATSGLPALINQYVPAFDQEGTNSAALPAAVTAGINGLRGLRGLGNAPLLDYRDPAQAAMMAGNYQQRQPQQLKALGSPDSGGGLKDLG